MAGSKSDIIDIENSYQKRFGIKKEVLSNKKIKIAVIDAYFDLYHPKFKNRLIVDQSLENHQNFINKTNIPKNIRPKQLNKKNYNPLNTFHDHGTQVLGIIQTISKNSEILPLQIYFDEDSRLKSHNKNNIVTDRTIEAVEFAIKEKVDIINYSTANGNFSKKEKEVFLKAQKAGIFVMVASGNEDINFTKSSNSYPAKYNLNNIFVIGGYNDHSKEIDGNYSKKFLDLNLISKKIFTTRPFDNFGRTGGTSMATAIFSGLLARKLINKKISFKNLRKLIKKYSQEKTSFKEYSKVNGILNIQNFLQEKKSLASKQTKKQNIKKRRKSLKLEDLAINFD